MLAEYVHATQPISENKKCDRATEHIGITIITIVYYIWLWELALSYLFWHQHIRAE